LAGGFAADRVDIIQSLLLLAMPLRGLGEVVWQPIRDSSILGVPFSALALRKADFRVTD
jgi:hypothetical protein